MQTHLRPLFASRATSYSKNLATPTGMHWRMRPTSSASSKSMPWSNQWRVQPAQPFEKKSSFPLIEHAVHAHAGTERVAQRTMHHAIQAVHILGGKGVAQKRLALMALLEKLDIALVEGRKRPHSLEGSGEHVAETVLH